MISDALTISAVAILAAVLGWLARTNTALCARVAVLEARQDDIMAALKRIEAKVDRRESSNILGCGGGKA